MKLPNKFNKEIKDWPLCTDEEKLDDYLDSIVRSDRLTLISFRTDRKADLKKLQKIIAALEEVNPYFQVGPTITQGLFQTSQYEGMSSVYVHIDKELYPEFQDQLNALDDLRLELHRRTKVKEISHRIWAPFINDMKEKKQ